MAILSSLFGASQQQPAVGAQPIQSAEIPTELKPYYTDILGKAQALYNKRTEEGFKPYEGPTMAQFTPEQQATFEGIAGLQGQVAPKFAEAEQLTRDAASQITGAQIQEAMSPYQQAVTDIEKRESQKAFEQNVLPKIRAAQVAQGSFGGTRGTLLEAQALADQQRGLADIQAKGSAAAFQDARAALEAERTRMGQGATQLANIAPTALKTGLAELGAQQTVGETKQRQAQTALDEAYRQFLQEKQEPYEAMQKYQAVVTGAPLTTTQYAQPAPPGPSLGQTLIGGLGTAAGLYGAFTGNNPLSAITGKKTGGGLSDALPIINARRGRPVGFNPYENVEDVFNPNVSGRMRGPQDLTEEQKGLLEKLGELAPEDRTPTGQSKRKFSLVSSAQAADDVSGMKYNPQDDFGGVTGLPQNQTTTTNNNLSASEMFPAEDALIKQEIEKRKLEKDKKDKQVKGGIADTRPIQGPPAPSKFDLREGDIRKEEEGLRSLYGQYAEKGKRDLSESQDARFRRQSANIAKAFAQFAQRGGEENILQKAIGTVGDNVDQFVATEDQFRKEKKAIEANLQKGKLEEARLGYDIVRDRAKRELEEEDRVLAKAKAESDEEYRKKLLELKGKELESNLKVNNAKILDLKKQDPAKAAEMSEARKATLLKMGVTINDKTGAFIFGGKALDGDAQKLMNTALAAAEIGTANSGTYSTFTKTAEYANLLSFIQNDILGSKVSEDANDASNQKAGDNIDSATF
jgi:hypothetical protein